MGNSASTRPRNSNNSSSSQSSPSNIQSNNARDNSSPHKSQRDNNNHNENSMMEEDHSISSSISSSSISSSSSSGSSSTREFTDVLIMNIKRHLKSGKPLKEFTFLEEEMDMGEDYCEAQKMYNREKNRYTNILPCDSTRVKLSSVDGVEGSDYINANFIDGEVHGSERAYIATQGPLMHTRSDFWRMVWENNSTTIVMLGKEKENDRIKVDRYWPEGPNGTLTFGPLTVRALGNEEDGGLTVMIRRLQLSHSGTGETRSIMHFQYEGWPDHGVPTSAAGIRHLVRLLESHSNTKIKMNGKHQRKRSDEQPITIQSPTVVHCSAGVGRTGTFCTIHITLTRLHHDREMGVKQPQCNLYKTVLKLRQQRPGMVQQQEQYVFCYEAVAEEAEELGLLDESANSSPTLTSEKTSENNRKALTSSLSSIHM